MYSSLAPANLVQPMMSIRYPPIPPNTVRASEEAFGSDHPYLKIGNSLEVVFSDTNLDAVAATDAPLADSFWPYSLATVLQYWEDLTDRQMANATRTRVDLKYALHLPLIFPGIDPSVLCKFRQRLVLNQAGRVAFQQVVNRVEDFLVSRKKKLADSSLIITTICTISRYEIVMEVMSNVVEALAADHPEWLRTIALPHWYKRYYYGQNPLRPSRITKNVESMFHSVGEDGQHLIKAVEESEVTNLMKLPEFQTLCNEWRYQFELEGEQLKIRSINCSNCARRI